MKTHNYVSDFTLRDIVIILFRYKMLIISTIFIIMGLTLLGLKMNTPMYEASVKILIKGQSVSAAETYQSLGSFRIHNTQTEIVNSTPVLRRTVIAHKLHERPLDYEKQFCSPIKAPLVEFIAKKDFQTLEEEKLSPEDKTERLISIAVNKLRKNLSTSLIPNSDVFVINVLDYSPEEAVRIANILSRSYAIFDLQSQLAELNMRYGVLHPSVLQLKDNIENMTENLSGDRLPDIEAIGTASVKVIEQASSNSLPVGKSSKLVFIMAFFAACFVSIALALLFNSFNKKFRSPQDIVTTLNIPVIGSVPKKKLKDGLLLSHDSKPGIYYSFCEDLAEQVYIFMKTQNMKKIIINSVTRLKSTQAVSSNIAFCISQLMGHRVLIVDLNLSAPVLSVIHHTGKVPSIDELKESESIDEYIQQIYPGLDIIPCSKSQTRASAFLKQTSLGEKIAAVQDRYDAVFFDCVNITSGADIILISEFADAVMLVINEGRDKKQVVKKTAGMLSGNNVKLVGGVLNNRTFPVPGLFYRYF